MSRITVDRLTEALAFICIAGAAIILVQSAKVSPAEVSLAQLRAQPVSSQDQGRFQELLNEARRAVDTNSDSKSLLDRLRTDFPGRHEVWALQARHFESGGLKGEALEAYARAVRLEPGYLDQASSLYLGKRIDALTGKVMEDLRSARKSRDLARDEKDLLKTAYFLKRRIAGGCE